MSELKEWDDNDYIPDDDEYETPDNLYERLCVKYEIYPEFDAMANGDNTKCPMFGTDALHNEWPALPTWINPPHSLTQESVRKTHSMWLKNNVDYMMIVPANATCAHFFDGILGVHAEYHRISGRPTFLKNGRSTKFPSRNSYFVVIWRKRSG